MSGEVGEDPRSPQEQGQGEALVAVLTGCERAPVAVLTRDELSTGVEVLAASMRDSGSELAPAASSCDGGAGSGSSFGVLAMTVMQWLLKRALERGSKLR